MLADRQSLEHAAQQALKDAELPAALPASEAFKMGFYAGFRAAKIEEQAALLKSMDPRA